MAKVINAVNFIIVLLLSWVAGYLAGTLWGGTEEGAEALRNDFVGVFVYRTLDTTAIAVVGLVLLIITNMVFNATLLKKKTRIKVLELFILGVVSILLSSCLGTLYFLYG